MTIDTQIAELKLRASFFLIKRRKDIDLYQVLADCMALCASIDGTEDLEKLKQEVIDRDSATGKRAFFLKDPDTFLIVGRAVFEPEINRAACWRYTATMREAAKRQIRPDELVDWLRSQGGINALFRARPVARRSESMRVLLLRSPVSVARGDTILLKLQYRSDGHFDVLSEEHPGGD